MRPIAIFSAPASGGRATSSSADGEEAVAAARQHHPDLILLDVMMPKVEACRQLKADADLPFTPLTDGRKPLIDLALAADLSGFPYLSPINAPPCPSGPHW
jgi:CheY-like chemotaxis protein